MNVYKIETHKAVYHVKANDVKHAYELASECLVNDVKLDIKSIILVCNLLDTEE